MSSARVNNGSPADRCCAGGAVEAVCGQDRQEPVTAYAKSYRLEQKTRRFSLSSSEEDLDWLEEVCGDDCSQVSYGLLWLTEEDETYEMAELVPLSLREEMMNMFSVSNSFPHLLLLQNGPKEPKIEEETWWTAYWSKEEVEKAKKRQERSSRKVDPYDARTWEVYKLCTKLGDKYRRCDMAASFERGPYHQRRFNQWMWVNFYKNSCQFPTLGCLCNLVRLKHELWNRYSFFFNVDAIEEVFPENELASWVCDVAGDYDVNCYVGRRRRFSNIPYEASL